MTLRSVVVVVLATLLITAMVTPVVALDAGTSAQASAVSAGTVDDWRLEITTRHDPYRTGQNNATRWVNGTVSLVDSEAVDIVTVTLNGNENESFEVPVEKPGTVADGEFNFTITLDQRVNRITVRGFPTNNTTISDTLVLDGDVLPDTYERETLGTAPDDPDSDSAETSANEADDGVIDAAEDFDGDELRAIDERRAGTDPLSVDTDDDGLRDGIEARYPGISPTSLDGNGDATPDRLGDLDGDGVDNLAEQEAGTYLHLSDTDNDGIPDAEEIDGATNATTFDTDGDGISDGVELAHGTDPTSADSDGDGVPDVNETLTTIAENATLGTTVEVMGRGPVATVTTVRNATTERFNTSVVRAARVGPVRRVEAGVNFSHAEVTVGYDESAVPHGNESDLVLYRQNETLNTFVPLNTSVDAADNQLTATIEEDSTVTAMAQSVWREEFPEQPASFGTEYTFENTSESSCEPGCEVENGTVRYGNASQSSSNESINESGPRIDDTDGGEETTTEQDVMGGFQQPESRSLPASTGDPLRAELQTPEKDYAEEPLPMTVVHNRNESQIESYEWHIYNNDSVSQWANQKVVRHHNGWDYNFTYNISVRVTTVDGETTWANKSKIATTHGKTPDMWVTGPEEAVAGNQVTFTKHIEEFGSDYANNGRFGFRVNGEKKCACTHFDYTFPSAGTYNVTFVQDFENGDTVWTTRIIEVEPSNANPDGQAPSVDLRRQDGFGSTVSVGEDVTLVADATDGGEIERYNWTVQRPDGRLFNPVSDSSSTHGGTVTRPGEYVIEVTVTDNDGRTGTDQYTLTASDATSSPTDPPSVDLRGPSFAIEGDNVSYYAAADDADGIQSYDWRIQRPNGFWFDPGNDDSETYGGVIDSGFYTVEVTVTDESGASTTRQQTVLGYGPDVDLQTKHTREIGQPIAVQSGTDSTVVEARVRGEANEGYAKLVAVGESGTREVFAVSATGAGQKDWRTVSVDLSSFAGETVTLRSEWTNGAEVEVKNVRVTRDWDGDGLSNNREREGLPYGNGRVAYTNPYESDSDYDGLDDKVEAGNFYPLFDAYRFSSNPAKADTDGDRLNDFEETRKWDTSPQSFDSDLDGYSDYVDPNPLVNDLPPSLLNISSDNYYGYFDATFYDDTGRFYLRVNQSYSGQGETRRSTNVDGKTCERQYAGKVRCHVDLKFRGYGAAGGDPDFYYVNFSDGRGVGASYRIKPKDTDQRQEAEDDLTALIEKPKAIVLVAGVGGAARQTSRYVKPLSPVIYRFAQGTASAVAGSVSAPAAAAAAGAGLAVGGIYYRFAIYPAEESSRERVVRRTAPVPPTASVREPFTPEGFDKPVRFPAGDRFLSVPDGLFDRGHGWEVIRETPGAIERQDVVDVIRAPDVVREQSGHSVYIGESNDGTPVLIRLPEAASSHIVLSAGRPAYDGTREKWIGISDGVIQKINTDDEWGHQQLGDTEDEVARNLREIVRSPDEIWEDPNQDRWLYIKKMVLNGREVIVFTVVANGEVATSFVPTHEQYSGATGYSDEFANWYIKDQEVIKRYVPGDSIVDDVNIGEQAQDPGAPPDPTK